MPAPSSKKKHRQAGFTLVEIMVVIVILGLLATLVVPNVLGISEDAKISKAQSDVIAIYNAAKIWNINKGGWPTLEQLTTPDEKDRIALEMVTTDPWDNEYVLKEIDGRRLEVISYGPDGSENTEDDISSILKKEQ